MRTTKISHRVIALFLMISFLPSLLPTNFLHASNNGPNAPEAAGFEPVDASDMVNLVTGDMSYVLPLLNVPSPEGGYPLALSYHAGIGVDQEASWVGLGWSLNPGAINRGISGVPDDWLETKKYSMMYNDIGVAKSISLGGGLPTGAISFAASLNYSSFKATGGKTTHDVGIGTSFSFFGDGSTSGFGAGGYIGTNGVGANAGYLMRDGAGGGAGVGLNAFQSFNGQGFSGGAYASLGGANVNINLSSRGPSASLSGLGRNVSLTGGDNLNGAIHQATTSFYLNFIFANFSYRKTNYWAYDASHSLYNGSLYAGKLNETYNDILDPHKLGIDAYEATYDSDRAEQLRNSNFSSISYDNYNISAQGIGGSISPKLLQNGALIMPISTLRTTEAGDGLYQIPSTNTTYLKPQAISKNFSKSLDKRDVHFYFENEYSSYLSVGSDNWSAPSISGSYNDLTNISSINRTFTDTREINGELFDSYNDTKERLKKGNFIETFTNTDIIETPSLIIHPEVTGFNRTDAYVPKDGIGAFRVTALDGKTYHYSLPVYHKEQFSRVSNVEDNSEDKFFEQQQYVPYATHWLLTAVTGSDYFDKNQNNLVDEQDYGYWSSFEYGKWSDGFAWRSPDNGYQSDGITNSYSWGVKEIYYLDKIKTRTHTALFIKEAREDNRSYSNRISNGTDAKHYNLPFDRSVIRGTDGNYYFQGAHLDIPIFNGQFQQYSSESDFWIYADYVEQRSLRLDKIVLLRNNDVKNISKSNSTDPNPAYAGRTFSKAKITLTEIASGRFVKDQEEFIDEDHTWYGEYYDFVLNNEDLDLASLKEQSLKTIDFNYDESYPLGRKTTESKGKLTLNSVSFIGRQGIQLMPSYKFGYSSSGTTYSENDVDDWGYFRSNAMIWSLNRITNPLGTKLEIVYENDRYISEYSRPTTFFEAGLEFKFGGTITGPKTVSFRNSTDVDPEYHVDFSEYFTAGQQTEIDVQFWHYTQTNSNWIADVAANCVVQEVTENLIVFNLPQNTNQSWGRENSDCRKKDWVYYDGQYNHVVDKTAIWMKRNNHNSCERPDETTNRSRYQIFAQKEPLNSAVGGGIRVKELIVKGDQHITKTTYNYTNASGEETGVTSYAVSKRNRVIPLITELPSPMVMYENVTTEEKDAIGRVISKKSYHFEVPKPIQYLSSGIRIGNVLETQIDQDDSYSNISVNDENVDVVLSKFKLFDYSANIGRLKSVKVINSENQQMSSIDYAYLPDNYTHDQGFLQETFSSYKQLRDAPLKDTYLMTSSSRVKIPNVLKKTTATRTGFTQEQEIIRYDFNTGQVRENSSLLSDGRLIKSKSVPAYSKYPGMASKVDNPSNSNMLLQPAVELTQVKVGNEWKTKDANITTWSNDWEYYNDEGTLKTPETDDSKKVWRKHQNYVWRGALDSNGFFQNYNGDDDGFVWGVGSSQTNQDWLKVSSTNLYNHYSTPLELTDINNNKATAKFGEKNSKIYATANSAYDQMYYSGAEDPDTGETYFGGGVQLGTASIVNDAHTGKNALSVSSGQSAFKCIIDNGVNDTIDYKISLWTKANGDNHLNTRIKVEGVQDPISFKFDETIRAGNWEQLNFYVPITGRKEIYVTSSNGSITIDDFRIHPSHSSLTSYVYNEWEELTHILGPNNMAVEYKYDEMGRLKETLTEVADFNGMASGGFKKSSEHKYTYKY